MESLLEALKKGRINEGQTINDNGYFDTYKDNIFGGKMETRFQKMFDEASGGELHSKAEAVHSSSMLSYNFFHWIDEKHPFTWNDIVYNKVLFEVKMNTLTTSRNRPACMDVVLIDKEKKNLLFIESKFTEYTKSEDFELSKSYEDEKKWYNEDIKWGKFLPYKPQGEAKYKGGIKQLITHLFGIHNLFAEERSEKKLCKDLEGKGIKFDSDKIKFITLVFEPKESDFTQEHKDHDNYKDLFNIFKGDLEKLKNVVGLSVIPEWKSYSDLWKDMKEQIPSKELKKFLWKRYMQFAEGAEEP